LLPQNKKTLTRIEQQEDNDEDINFETIQSDGKDKMVLTQTTQENSFSEESEHEDKVDESNDKQRIEEKDVVEEKDEGKKKYFQPSTNSQKFIEYEKHTPLKIAASSPSGIQFGTNVLLKLRKCMKIKMYLFLIQ